MYDWVQSAGFLSLAAGDYIIKWMNVGGDGTLRCRLDCVDLIERNPAGVEEGPREPARKETSWGNIRALYR